MSKTLVIAEAGVNHNGDADLAFALVEAAAAAGADVIKFQTFQADLLVAPQTPKAAYQKQLTDAAESQLEMLRRLQLSTQLHFDLKKRAEELGLEFMSTGFDFPSTDFLFTLDLKRYKIPSGELTNAPLLWHTAKRGRPLLLSTGMATMGDIEIALAVVAHATHSARPPTGMAEVWQSWNNPAAIEKMRAQVTLLHCTSQYPCPDELVNLRAMTSLANAFGVTVGYSDHSLGCLVPVTAVALGACVIEKHFTLDRNLPGPDHQASLIPSELSQMVSDIRRVEQILGHGIKQPQFVEWQTQQVVRQRLVAKQPIKCGQLFDEHNLTTARSVSGLAAVHYWDLLGKPAGQDYLPMSPVVESI